MVNVSDHASMAGWHMAEPEAKGKRLGQPLTAAELGIQAGDDLFLAIVIDTVDTAGTLAAWFKVDVCEPGSPGMDDLDGISRLTSHRKRLLAARLADAWPWDPARFRKGEYFSPSDLVRWALDRPTSARASLGEFRVLWHNQDVREYATAGPDAWHDDFLKVHDARPRTARGRLR
jgi:hypothetical protein